MDGLLFMSLMQIVAPGWTTFTYFFTFCFYCISVAIYDEANNCFFVLVPNPKLHDTGKRVRVYETETHWKRDPAKIWILLDPNTPGYSPHPSAPSGKFSFLF